jgi:hypothetical protein
VLTMIAIDPEKATGHELAALLRCRWPPCRDLSIAWSNTAWWHVVRIPATEGPSAHRDA